MRKGDEPFSLSEGFRSKGLGRQPTDRKTVDEGQCACHRSEGFPVERSLTEENKGNGFCGWHRTSEVSFAFFQQMDFL